MNLIPSGDIKPTSGANGVHEPLILYFEGQPVRFIIRDGVPFDLAPAWVLVDVAKALGFKDPHRAGRSFLKGGESDSHPSDKGMALVATPGGPQSLQVVTYTGLTKLLMRSDKETARRFQDWLAAKSSDLTFYGVAFRDTSAAEVGGAITEARLQSELGSIRSSIAVQRADFQELTTCVRLTLETTQSQLAALHRTCNELAEWNRQQAAENARRDAMIGTMVDIGNHLSNSRPIAYDAKSARELLPRLTASEKKRMAADGFVKTGEYLQKVTGDPKPRSKDINSLSQRVTRHCEQVEATIRRYLERGRPVNYYPWIQIDTVYRERLPVDGAGQGKLFNLDAKRQERRSS